MIARCKHKIASLPSDHCNSAYSSIAISQLFTFIESIQVFLPFFRELDEMAQNDRDDPLAYGDYHNRGYEGEEGEGYEGGERGLVGDAYQKIRSKYRPQQGASSMSGQSQSVPPNGGPGQSGGLASSLFNTIHGVVHGVGSEINQRLSGKDTIPSIPNQASQPSTGIGAQATSQNQFGSFATQRYGNDVKWYVDGCGYMWAVSTAIEQARESIWILDCKFLQIRFEWHHWFCALEYASFKPSNKKDIFGYNADWPRVAFSGIISTETTFSE